MRGPGARAGVASRDAHRTVMLTTAVGRGFHNRIGDPGAMAENDTLHDDGASREEHDRLEALAHPRSVANPRRTKR